MPNLFVSSHSPPTKTHQRAAILAYLDPPKVLFLLALCYLIPTIGFGEYQAHMVQRILGIVMLFFWLLSHTLSKNLTRFSEEIKGVLAFLAYILVLVSRMQQQNQSESGSEPVADISFYAIMSANLERILIFTFMKLKIGLAMNIVAIICRYAMFQPEKTLTIVISAIGDAIILGYTCVHFRILNTNKSETHLEEKENSFFEKMFLQIYTPLVLIDAENMKPIFHNKEMDDILENASLGISELVTTLFRNMDHEHIDDIFNSFESSSPQALHRKKTLSETNEMIGNIKGKNGCELTFNIKVTKENFNEKDVLFVQLKDMSFQEKVKSLEASNAYKDHVLNTVAHDLRNPLGAITGILKHLDITIKEHHNKDFIKTCMTLGELLVNILNTYLDGAQIKNNKIRLVPAEINMKEYLRDLFKIFDFLCKQKNIGFSIKIKTSIPGAIFSDQHRITQILINLISNAIKFTPNGNISLVISANYDSDDTHPLLNFAVTDTGVGISQENQQKLFQAFSKLDGSSKLNPYGVGLGLIISNDLVSLLNKIHQKECIRVESALNKGSTFSFTISSMLEAASPLRPSPSDCLNESFASKISSDEHSLSSDTANAIEVKVQDYSKDYGRLNGSKFHSPKERKESPKSFSLLLENTSFEALKNPKSPGVSPGPSKWKTLAPAKLKSETTIQAQTFSYVKSTSLVDTQGKFSNFLHNALIETQKRLVSMDRIKTPVSRTQLNQEEWHTMTILVVDDDPFNILAVSPGLMEKGFEVIYAMNGEDCIQNVKEKAKEKYFFEAILMDCDMPIMNGFEATTILVEMMRNKEIPTIPIVGLTGSEDEETIKKCKGVGMVGVIGKPFQEQKLYEILKI